MPKQSSSVKRTSLSAVEQYELNQWLEENRINSSNLRRSFTDVLPLARLMSRYYPDMIDLNYYPPRNSVQNKLCNWESFNKRVLARLGLQLTRDQMVRVARSVPGSVDLLLYSVMRVQMAAERKAREERPSSGDDDDMNVDEKQSAGQPDDTKDDRAGIKPMGVAVDTVNRSLKQTPALPLKRAAAAAVSVKAGVARGGGSGGGGGGGVASTGRNKRQQLTMSGASSRELSHTQRQRGRQSVAAKKR
ncbi:sperm flagellar protein 1-like [Drosophila novamexicana]|uniref:sperm flagellar protein 1-like n=1 Tax=Drosophila novamexicana TaxID=47314 RepID=UPI0011E5C622|nr:sperm flagellar protein 1-like [Drosophila novamexicana]